MDDDMRQYLIEDFISNVRSPTVDVSFDKALQEFLSRLPELCLERLSDNVNPIVINATGACFPELLFIQCPKRKPHRNGVRQIRQPLVVFGAGLEKASHEVRVGVIAHEFAHIWLGQYGGNAAMHEREEMRANRLAKRWGFKAEIEAMRRAGWGHGQTPSG